MRRAHKRLAFGLLVPITTEETSAWIQPLLSCRVYSSVNASIMTRSTNPRTPLSAPALRRRPTGHWFRGTRLRHGSLDGP